MNEWHYWPEDLPERDGTYLTIFRYPEDTYHCEMRFELIDYCDHGFHVHTDLRILGGEEWKLVAWRELKLDEVIPNEPSATQGRGPTEQTEPPTGNGEPAGNGYTA